MVKKIIIPHLGYRINVKKFKPSPTLENAIAWVHSINSNECDIYLQGTSKQYYATIAHEVVHILQFICLNRNIDFTLEHEHMGYLMQYILNEITDYKYDI